MSRGLSRLQREILAKIKEEGCLNVFDVADILVRIRSPSLSRSPLSMLGDVLRRLPGAKNIDNISAIYRMMRSLERRGHVATVLHLRPREWYHVEWKDNNPNIDIKKGKAFLLLAKRQLLFRTRGKIWEIILPKEFAKKRMGQ